MAQPEVRPMRMCNVCGGVDDHPRHVHGVAPGDAPTTDEIAALALENAGPEHFKAILSQIRDNDTQIRHMDCCREAGCPDGSCNEIAKTGAEELRGMDLVEHLTSGKVDDIGKTLTDKRAEAAMKELGLV
jgi:hypothetical protein